MNRYILAILMLCSGLSSCILEDVPVQEENEHPDAPLLLSLNFSNETEKSSRAYEGEKRIKFSDSFSGSADIAVEYTDINNQPQNKTERRTISGSSYADIQISVEDAKKFRSIKISFNNCKESYNTGQDIGADISIFNSCYREKKVCAYYSVNDFVFDGFIQHGNKYYKHYITHDNEAYRPFSVIELSGIRYGGPSSGQASKFSELTFGGVFLDRIAIGTLGLNIGAGYEYSSPHTLSPTMNGNLKWKDCPAYYKVEATSPTGDFTTSGRTWPATGNAYIFPIFPQSETSGFGLPMVKLYFSRGTYSNGKPIPADGLYAVLTRYKDSRSGQYITSFEPGKIYRIESITPTDDNITPNPDGGNSVGVTATVSIQPWQVITTDPVTWQ